VNPQPFQLAARTARMNPSVIREILKLTERPGVLSMAGGLPSPDGFPVEAIRAASERVLRDSPREALQYAGSEGYGPLREWIAARLTGRGVAVDAERVLITSGSQQGLDLLGKVLLDAGSTVAVEAPSYLGALQAFAPAEPRFAAMASDGQGLRPEALADASAEAERPRFAYVLPSFQNPTGRLMSEARRAAVVAAAQAAGVPLVEDDPYGDLWFDQPPPAPLAARWSEGTVYLGSFSKILAPGLRLGYLIAPPAIAAKLLQAKQAADLHTSGFVQRIAFEAVKDGLLDHHLPAVRALYRAQRDAMGAALLRHLPAGCDWQTPQGGMFFWLRLPVGLDATALLPRAVAAGVAYVPGAPFFAGPADDEVRRCLRLSFVTLPAEQIERGIAALGAVLHEALAGSGMPGIAASERRAA